MREGPNVHDAVPAQATPLNSLALSATVHCLTGCAIGEVLGLLFGTALGWGSTASIALAVVLAFFFGYLLTLLPLLAEGVWFRTALGLAFASDTLSIAVMEIVDNAVMLIVPGAMDAGPSGILFWMSLALSLVVAFVVAFPVNRWLISRGRGHALVHAYHHEEACLGAEAWIATRTVLLTVGLLASTLVGCAGLPVQEDDTLAAYRQELAKLVEAGVLTKEDEEKFYRIASLEMERRAKQRRQPSDSTTLPTGFGPPARKATEL